MSASPHTELTQWEQWPVVALMAAAGLNTALWYIGASMPEGSAQVLPWLVVLAGIASVIAIDGALVATIAGIRQGRRGRWSYATISVTALFTALAALSAHQVLSRDASAWLHGLFALTIVAYAMHLAQPRQDALLAVALREQELERREQDVASREQAVAQAEQVVSSREQELERREQTTIRYEQVEIVRIATAELTWRQFEQIVRRAITDKAASMSSLRRLVNSVEEEHV